MRIVALLSWFNERPDWLADTVRSLALAEVDALVAVDGSYAHFPNGAPQSPLDQSVAIHTAADDAGIECRVLRPPSLWPSEPAKRTVLFRAGYLHNPDWFLVIDADEVIIAASPDFKDRLAATDRDCAEVCSLEQPATVHGGADMPQIAASRWVKPRRCLFRAIPGLHVGEAHSDYLTPDGRNLWGDGDERALQIRELVIDHRNGRRDPGRREAAQTYYRERDERGIERHRVTSWGLAGPEKVAETNALLAAALEEA